MGKPDAPRTKPLSAVPKYPKIPKSLPMFKKASTKPNPVAELPVPKTSVTPPVLPKLPKLPKLPSYGRRRRQSQAAKTVLGEPVTKAAPTSRNLWNMLKNPKTWNTLKGESKGKSKGK